MLLLTIPSHDITFRGFVDSKTPYIYNLGTVDSKKKVTRRPPTKTATLVCGFGLYGARDDPLYTVQCHCNDGTLLYNELFHGKE